MSRNLRISIIGGGIGGLTAACALKGRGFEAEVYERGSERREGEADIVIGADGIRSRVRESLFDDEQPRYTGQLGWRAVLPMERVPEVGPHRDISLREDFVGSFHFTPGPAMTPGAIEERMREERARWRKIVQDIGLQPQ